LTILEHNIIDNALLNPVYFKTAVEIKLIHMREKARYAEVISPHSDFHHDPDSPPVLHRGQVSGLQAGLQKPAPSSGKLPYQHPTSTDCQTHISIGSWIVHWLYCITTFTTCYTFTLSPLVYSSWSIPTTTQHHPFVLIFRRKHPSLFAETRCLKIHIF